MVISTQEERQKFSLQVGEWMGHIGDQTFWEEQDAL